MDPVFVILLVGLVAVGLLVESLREDTRVYKPREFWSLYFGGEHH